MIIKRFFFPFLASLMIGSASLCFTISQSHADGLESFVGKMRFVRSSEDETLHQIMREHNVGYVEIRAANPTVDVWEPGKGTDIIIPSWHILPDAPREGIVINLSEMRLYDYTKNAGKPKTHPIGIGREGLGTPLGKTKITRKKDGPTWTPTQRMREEDPTLPVSMGPGEDNPLGTHALYLGWPSYLIHGTNKPYGIGRRVSSGCIRMYPEDIIDVFDRIPVGTKVNIIKQPIKMAWLGDILYLEAHADERLADDIERNGKPSRYVVPRGFFGQLKKTMGEHYAEVDWELIKTVLTERRGYPVAIFDLQSRSAKNTEDQKDLKQPEEEKTAEADIKEEAEKPVKKRRNMPRNGFNN